VENKITSNFKHKAVMLDEVLDVVDRIPPGVFIDATVGGASHSEEILTRRLDIEIVAVDRDHLALEAARSRLERFSERVRYFHDSFSSLERIFNDESISSISGFLFDLGVSSPQLDNADRGFSYRFEGPLDMRMDTRQEETASYLLNNLDRSELQGIIERNSDERFAARIAGSIVNNRPIKNTLELAELVKKAIPAATRRKGGHPAKRTFQAIRMEVNDEREELIQGVTASIKRLKAEACGMVISYHSGEDRIAKELFRNVVTGGCNCPSKLPCVCGAVTKGQLPHSGLTASKEEIKENRRSKSARLRVLESL
jgi:16S rRNA (cytosine1402-N4)-methyltransferase